MYELDIDTNWIQKLKNKNYIRLYSDMNQMAYLLK